MVLQGSCRLAPLPGGAGFEPVELEPGDVALPGAACRTLWSSRPVRRRSTSGRRVLRRARPSVASRSPAPARDRRSCAARTGCTGTGRTRCCGTCPRWCTGRPCRHPSLRALVQLLGDELESRPPGAAVAGGHPAGVHAPC
ncbi:cupin domain-containing protein [Amycolatopsis sp. FDAARGOS 1241]|uniref:cupin domain-containing protein n=1 Tax=Amycolatopsis sp. FDAARGOS 1241 TaxID=2778070 RepID=UPI00351C55B4